MNVTSFSCRFANCFRKSAAHFRSLFWNRNNVKPRLLFLLQSLPLIGVGVGNGRSLIVHSSRLEPHYERKEVFVRNGRPTFVLVYGRFRFRVNQRSGQRRPLIF